MQTHKEKANYKRKLESSREYLHHMYADEKVDDKAKEAFKRPLFGVKKGEKMVKEFCKAWEANKGNLEEYFRTHTQDNYDSYEALVKLLFDIVINPSMKSDYYRFRTDDMTVLDHGEWQGTLIFILHMNCYQPSVDEYVYTSVGYGSCSSCDTLQGIHSYGTELPSEQQVKDYMTLCLHLLQRCNYMKYREDEDES